MKSVNYFAVAAIILTAVQAYAGNGDLIVNGKASIGTTTQVSPLTVGTPIYDIMTPGLVGNQVNIADQPTALSGYSPTLHLVSQPNPAANSTALVLPIFSELYVPATSTVNLGALNGIRSRVENYGSGTVTNEQGLLGTSYNNSATATVTTQSGNVGGAYNTSTGTVTTQYGIRGITMNTAGGLVTNQYAVEGTAQNSSTSSITNQYGLHGFTQNIGTGTIANSYGTFTNVSNTVTGTITTAYGLAIGNPTTAGISNPSGTITTGYGLYVGANQATNKWAIYSDDATAPSYFAGNIGIGVINPNYKLDVQGLIASNGTVLTSDAKFKKNLLSISNPLDKVLNLNGLSYEWKTEEYKEKNFSTGRHYGVIAQEIEQVLPEVVSTDTKGDKSVAYTEIIPVLIEAIKEQQKIIKNQDKRISELETITNKLIK